MSVKEPEKRLHVMVGLPRSGKSTEARSLGYPVVCPDEIRKVIHGTPFRDNVEGLVWGIAHVMVESLFGAGHDDVTLDACNVTPERRIEWENPAWACVYHVVSTPAEMCRARARQLLRDDLIPVIDRMAAAWNPPGMGKDC